LGTNEATNTEEGRGNFGKTDRRKDSDEWVTDEILDLFNERRTAATRTGRTQYQQIQRKLREEIREAKANLMKEKCERIEQLHKLYETKDDDRIVQTQKTNDAVQYRWKADN
jgi:hypothetical protein